LSLLKGALSICTFHWKVLKSKSKERRERGGEERRRRTERAKKREEMIERERIV
jgi:hypothetical protein